MFVIKRNTLYNCQAVILLQLLLHPSELRYVIVS